MRRKIISMLVALFVVALVTSTAFGANEAKNAETPKKEKPEWTVYEEYWVLWVDEPAYHFSQAHESFLKKDLAAAGREIRTGAAFLKLEAKHASGEGKQALMDSIHELDKLADDVEKGAVASAKKLDDAFARAHHALAKHQGLKAREALVERDNELASQRLKAAATHLERAMTWAGYKEEDLVVKAVKDTELFAGKLTEDIGLVPEEAGKLLDEFGRAIDKLGKAIEPSEQ